MASVIRRIRRTNKKAAKYRFTATLEELLLVGSEKWKPNTVIVSFLHRCESLFTSVYSWERYCILAVHFLSFAVMSALSSWYDVSFLIVRR